MAFKIVDTDWALTQAELEFLKNYRGKNKLQCALFMKHYQETACFPCSVEDFVFPAIRSISEQLSCDHNIQDLDFQDRTAERQRHNIREFLNFRLPNSKDYTTLQKWLAEEVVEAPDQESGIDEEITSWCLQHKVEKPAVQKRDRIIKGAIAAFEARIFEHVISTLPLKSRDTIDRLFSDDEENDAIFSLLKSDPGKASLKSVVKELMKLEAIDRAGLPNDLFAGVKDKTVTQYRMRAATESIWDMRRHPDSVRYTLAAAFLLQRRREIIDGLVELLIQIIHKIKIRSEKRVTKEIAGNVREVAGKKMLLFKLAEAALSEPEGAIRDVLFPVVGEDTLEDLVKEFRADRPVYHEKVQFHARNSYKNHYRQMIPSILEALTFHCNNQHHRPVIEALDYLALAKKKQRKVWICDVPIDGIIPKSLQPVVIQNEEGRGPYVERISYEICVLQALRDGLRCREIWVEGAYKFRNPDEDIPQDFETKRASYYQTLNLPLQASDFVGKIKLRMQDSLEGTSNNHLRLRRIESGAKL